jgi:hypothetical protein
MSRFAGGIEGKGSNRVTCTVGKRRHHFAYPYPHCRFVTANLVDDDAMRDH